VAREKAPKLNHRSQTRLGLTLNETKTSLKNARQERFDFLGYSFGPHRYKANGKWYLSASPSKKSMQRFKTKVGNLLVPRTGASNMTALTVRYDIPSPRFVHGFVYEGGETERAALKEAMQKVAAKAGMDTEAWCFRARSLALPKFCPTPPLMFGRA
jgi:hypothetical protein